MAITAAKIQVDVDAETRGFTRGMDKADSKVGRFSDRMKSGLKTLAKWGAAAAAAGTAAAGAFAFKAVGAAMELNETISKTEQVFGDATSRVTGFADRMADAFGAPKQEMLDAASNIGLVAKASGLGEDAAAGMSVQMAELAADASSFFNVPLPQALEKIRAGLVGEAEPLRQFGVLLSAAAVEEKAVAAGIAEAGQELTEQQKVMARSMIIQEQMGDASGDLERTQDSLANKVRALKGRFTNFTAEIGQKLIPVGESLVGWVETSALPAFQRFADWIVSRGVPALQAIGGWISREVVPRLQEMADWFDREVTPRVMDFVDAVKDNWPNIQRIFNDLARVVGAVGKAIGDSFTDMREESDDTARSTADDVGTIVGVLAQFTEAIADIVEAFSRFIGWTHRIRIAIHDNVISPIKSVLAWMVDGDAAVEAGRGLIAGFIRGIDEWGQRGIDRVKSFFTDSLATARRVLGLSSPSRVFYEFGENTIQGYINGIEDESTTLQDVMKNVFDDAIGGVSDIIGGISALRGQREAQAGVREAQAELTELQKRQADLPDLIADAKKALSDAVSEAKKVTPKEELKILRAKEDVLDAEERLTGAREEGTASADELRILELELEDAESRLTDAKKDAKSKTDAVRSAEQRLKDLRAEQKSMAGEMRSAEDALTEAKLRAVQAEQSLAQAGRALLDQGPASVDLFKQIAKRAGLSADEVDRMVEKTSALTLKVGGFKDAGEAFKQKLKDIAEDAKEAGSSAGGASGKVDGLGDSIGSIPSSVDTLFKADIDPAMTELQKLREEMRRLNREGFNVAVPGTSSGGLVMHAGGFVPGSRNDEVPTILQGGEFVVSHDMMRRGSTPAGGGTTVVQVRIGDRELDEIVVEGQRARSRRGQVSAVVR